MEVWLFVRNDVVARRCLVILRRGERLFGRILAGDGQRDGDAEEARVGVIRDVVIVRGGE